MAFQIIIYIGLGILPSLIWLLFYLHEDSHPEPKALLLQVFVLGMAAAPLAREIEKGLILFLQSRGWLNILMLLILVAVIEEIIKFLVVRLRVLRDPDFDEPIDAMIYMIVAALGFAALENIFYLFEPSNDGLTAGLTTALARFVSATLFHALAAGIVGYCLARAIFAKKRHWSYVSIGLAVAIGFHLLFNWWMLERNIALVGLMLLVMAVLLAKGFDALRKQVVTQRQPYPTPV